MPHTTSNSGKIDLFERFAQFNSLLIGWAKIRANRGGPGSDGITLEEFEQDLRLNLEQLEKDLTDSVYRPMPFLVHSVEKQKGGVRKLYIPTVRDRTAQSALAQLLTPLLEREFEDSSFGYRPGRGVPHAVRRIMQLRDQGFRWVVDADIDDFFDSIDHDRLIAKCSELISDSAVLALIRLWIGGELYEEGHLVRITKGLPQGSPISPLLANLYLDELDEALMARQMKAIRFADDFIILCKEEQAAREALSVTDEVVEALHLKLGDTSGISHFETGFRYLGTVFFRDLVLTTSKKRKNQRRGSRQPALVSLQSLTARAGATETTVGAAMSRLVSELAEEGRDLYLQDLPPEPVSEPDEEEKQNGQFPPPLRRMSVLPDPDKQTLYLTEPGCVIGQEGERLLVRQSGQVLLDAPIFKVERILIFGNSTLTTPAIRACLQNEIDVNFLSSTGRYYGVLSSPGAENVLLQRMQFQRLGDMDFCLTIAKAIVRNKIHNCRILLERIGRGRQKTPTWIAADNIRSLLEATRKAGDLDTLRGYEGAAARAFFEGYSLAFKQEWGFRRRVRQPPTDPINSLLSFGYTLVFYQILSLVRAFGLNPNVGFLHSLRRGHPALVSDLVEEFRTPIVESLVLYILNNRMLDRSCFKSDSRGCFLTPVARKKFLVQFDRKMRTEIVHPHSGTRLDYRGAMAVQAQSMANAIRGAVSSYRPFEMG
ncbi:MAG: CRISPR-associated endonuclease Cas1 [Acidobacteriota bacterium]